MGFGSQAAPFGHLLFGFFHGAGVFASGFRFFLSLPAAVGLRYALPLFGLTPLFDQALAGRRFRWRRLFLCRRFLRVLSGSCVVFFGSGHAPMGIVVRLAFVLGAGRLSRGAGRGRHPLFTSRRFRLGTSGSSRLGFGGGLCPGAGCGRFFLTVGLCHLTLSGLFYFRGLLLSPVLSGVCRWSGLFLLRVLDLPVTLFRLLLNLTGALLEIFASFLDVLLRWMAIVVFVFVLFPLGQTDLRNQETGGEDEGKFFHGAGGMTIQLFLSCISPATRFEVCLNRLK
ncbi:MAG: hypothetical protein KDN19_06295 [Verrucomicrobiae bacterium]|nr:hypothetical protein [Verrucomicrobiae bacterium]